MRGRGAAERGRGRAQRPSVGVVGWPPESSAGFRGARPQDRSHGSVVRNGAVTFAIARLRRRVFVQSTEPEVVTEKALEGQNPGEHRPGRPWASSGASSRDFAVGRVNGLPGGARLRSGRAGRSRRARLDEETIDGSERSRSGWLVSRRGPKGSGQRSQGSRWRRPASLSRPSGGETARGRARSVKAIVKRLATPRRERIEREPARKHRPARAGTAPREGKALKGESQGRSWSGNRLRKLRGVATTELQERGNSSLQESARLKPPRGHGSPIESAWSTAR